MNTRIFSFFSFATACGLLTASLAGGTGCSSGSGSGGSGGSTGTGGAGGSVTLDPADKISDFEDLAAATVVMAGGRNGYWYTYNDDNPAGTDATCVQTPKSGPQIPAPMTPPPWIPSAPATPAPGPSGSMALHATWMGCGVWGAGIGADLAQPNQDGGTYTGPKVPYDVGAYTGVTFWMMAATGTDTALRIKFPMTADTKDVDGGKCVDSATNKCSDDFGYKFNLPANGNWKQVTVKFSDANFVQEGWGAKFPWDPKDVTSIQFQSQDKTESYDIWIDDLYFIK
jgi:hypothetical protein